VLTAIDAAIPAIRHGLHAVDDGAVLFTEAKSIQR
jgi:hypothetical protein